MKVVRISHYVLTALSFFLTCCNHDKTIPPCSSCCSNPSGLCTDTPIPPPNIEYLLSYDTTYTILTYQNPNDPGEFIFYKPYTTIGVPQLIKYNMLSHARQVIYTGQLTYRPSWGISGWILLNIGATVYKIKDNGDSLTRLTFLESDYGPQWNPGSTKFITEHVKGGFGNSIIYDKDGNILDTITNATPGDGWQNDSLIAYPRSNGSFGIGVTNVNQNTFYDLFNDGFNTGDAIHTCFWSISQNTIYYTTLKGIYSYDVSSKSRKCLKATCPNDTYLSLSTFNSSSLLMSKEHQRWIGVDVLKVTSKIVLLNLDGSNEREVDIQ